jgi:4-amino-4-deoxy-L-arabinose transferase-like glycosyltransferase
MEERISATPDRSVAERRFLLRVFLLGLGLRVAVAAFIALADLEGFFGGDAGTYDWVAWAIARSWSGESAFSVRPASQPGYFYVVAAFYVLFGRAPFLVVLVNCAIGALHAVLIYKIAASTFDRQVARGAALLTACFPSLVLWSAQLLKDALVIFCTLLSIYAVLVLRRRFSVIWLTLLLLALLSLHPLRNYVFYIVAFSAVLSLVGHTRGPIVGLFAQIALAFALLLILTNLGVVERELQTLSIEGVLGQIHLSRTKLARFAQSGYAPEADVSTLGGALRFLPIGLAYLLLAPFPWSVANVRQAITLPEMLLWWGMLPWLGRGVAFAVRRKLADTSPILLFVSGLTLVYALFQGNVGTAYRQRAQILVFLFIFVVAGWRQRRRARGAEAARDRPLAPSSPTPIA